MAYFGGASGVALNVDGTTLKYNSSEQLGINFPANPILWVVDDAQSVSNIPTSITQILITSNGSLTLDADIGSSINTVTNNGTVTVASGITVTKLADDSIFANNGTLTVTGTLTVASGKTFTAGTLGGAGTLTVTGTIKNTKNITVTTVNGSGVMILDGCTLTSSSTGLYGQSLTYQIASNLTIPSGLYPDLVVTSIPSTCTITCNQSLRMKMSAGIITATTSLSTLPSVSGLTLAGTGVIVVVNNSDFLGNGSTINNLSTSAIAVGSDYISPVTNTSGKYANIGNAGGVEFTGSVVGLYSVVFSDSVNGYYSSMLVYLGATTTLVLGASSFYANMNGWSPNYTESSGTTTLYNSSASAGTLVFVTAVGGALQLET